MCNLDALPNEHALIRECWYMCTSSSSLDTRGVVVIIMTEFLLVYYHISCIQHIPFDCIFKFCCLQSLHRLLVGYIYIVFVMNDVVHE